MPAIKLSVPFLDESHLNLKAGDRVLLSGTLYAARDAAHKRMAEALNRGDALPIEISSQVIYYVGPTPAKPGHAIGSAGPTTSGRMDAYTPALLDLGLKGMIGKGYRSSEVIESIQKNKAVYFAAIGGTGALLARSIKAVEVVAYEDLGPEAIRRLVIENFPAIVIHDSQGNDWYKQGQAPYQSI